MLVKANHDYKSGLTPVFEAGKTYEVTPAELEWYNRDSEGLLTPVGGAEGGGAAPVNRMDTGVGLQTRSITGDGPAMSTQDSGLVTGPAGGQVDAPVEVDEVDDIDATDAAIALADDLDVDLATVVGTGKAGRITLGDVRAAAAEDATE